MVAKKITSLQHRFIKHCISLRKISTYRQENQQVLIMGKNLVKELDIQVLITTSPTTLSAPETILVTDEIMKKITNLQNPDGFAAVCSLPKEQSMKNKNYLLILDQVRDPGNLGTLMRTALALNWEGVVFTPDTVDPFNDKALRAGKGAQFHLPFAFLSYDKIDALKMDCFCADIKGEEIQNSHFASPMALIMGSEGQGSSEWAKKQKRFLKIPIHPKSESLNVATAGAILMYAMRQA